MMHKITPPTRPLQVSTAPLPSAIRLHIAVAPDAPLGQCDVQVGLVVRQALFDTLPEDSA